MENKNKTRNKTIHETKQQKHEKTKCAKTHETKQYMKQQKHEKTKQNVKKHMKQNIILGLTHLDRVFVTN